ncbi:MAG: 1-deoxy-D-xylulose-5-phosphate reductoisomerase [Aquidulcibacter sp.]|jgi:1-deoxy-D-xylulose-5-phosphate reductoisomerase|uniref:1-deoxy-D-xylulose-5-phosphate reductoisomerase n=1 Tax=Aquidulcibacter sp. TaxID=2052990 RepID=UPI0022BCA6B9|nr:1-deoxy-D-xylulose-5-phosphate reductoisomerase [Aquidulcibacter sp.]
MTKSLTILGATGSIGLATLDVVMEANARARAAGQDDAYRVIALTANRDWAGLAEQAILTGATFVALSDGRFGPQLEAALAGHKIEIGLGPEAVVEAAARPADVVMAAIVGAAGLAPTLAAAKRGATIALANKECLVCAGSVFLKAVRDGGGSILPVDSEHNAIFQVLDQSDRVEKLILTASGGPFRTWSAAAIAAATPEQAVAHPNWSMGQKISVDSATLMNKGLELIEAALLFGMPENKIDVLVHPQSVIHSLVAYQDGSVLAQLGAADMRIPIAHALAWPARLVTSAPRLDLAAIAKLDFEVPDLERFPALSLARSALQKGGAAPTILNAANEVAVQAFLDRNVSFPEIAAIVLETMDEACRLGMDAALGDLDDVYAADEAGRSIAVQNIAKRKLVSV